MIAPQNEFFKDFPQVGSLLRWAARLRELGDPDQVRFVETLILQDLQSLSAGVAL